MDKEDALSVGHVLGSSRSANDITVLAIVCGDAGGESLIGLLPGLATRAVQLLYSCCCTTPAWIVYYALP